MNPWSRTLIPAVALITVLVGCNGEQPDGKSDIPQTDTVSVHQNPMEMLNEQIKTDPNNPKLYAMRADLHVGAGALEDAIQDAQRALDLDSSQVEFWLLRGKIDRLGLKLGLARTAFESALARDPENVIANLGLAEIFLVLQDYQTSIDKANEALKVDVYNAQAYYLKGQCFKETGDTLRALSSYQTCVEQDPEHYEAYIELGLLNQRQKNDLAVAYYNNAIEVEPRSVEAHYNKGKYYLDQGRLDEARETYQKLLEIRPDYKEAHFNLGYVELFAENYATSIEHFDRAIGLHPGYFEAYYNRGYAHELAGDREAARKDFKQALSIRPDYTLAAKGLSRLEN